MTLTPSPEIEKALMAAAVKTGRSPEELAEETLREKYAPLAENADDEPTLAELFAGRTGLVDSEGQYNYSSRTGRAYTESLLKQKEQAAKIKEG